MIFTHIIIGMLPVYDLKFSWFWFLGSIMPDIDHIFVLLYYRIFSYKKIVESMRDEEKYSIRFRTKYVHSLFGSIILSSPIFFFSTTGGLYFVAGYILHLLLDWPDKDRKQYLFPFKKEFKGFLPIFSKPEQIFSCILALFVIIVYITIK